MGYFKIVDNEYISGIGRGNIGDGIGKNEYSHLLEVIKSSPIAPDGYTYKLRADNLEWELVELPPVEPEPLTDEEALTRYANELTGQNDPDLISAAETLIEQRIKEE